MFIDQSIQVIRKVITDKKVTRRQLALDAAVAEGSTRRILAKKWNPTLNLIQKLESAARRYCDPPDY